MENPKLRAVQFFPVMVENKRMGCLHDPQKISDKPLLIPWEYVTLLPYLDGNHSLLDIQAEYTRHFGDLLFKEDLIEFLQKLDHYLFLDSARFHEFEAKIKEAFLNAQVRPAFYSGLSYSSDPKKLREELTHYFTSENGPGFPACQETSKRVTGLVAPHIDLSSGGPCFAWAYSELIRSAVWPDLFIILGTCHAGVNRLFALTDKSFQTPLGTITCDKNFMRLLSKAYGSDLYTESFLHRSEHTIEFQILFLQFIREGFGAERPPLNICPILCAFTPGYLSENASEKETYTGFIESLRSAIADYDQSVCIIASADLAHMGVKFGDPRPLNRYALDACFRKDREMLEMVAIQDKKGFLDHMMQEHDKRRICGFPPLTALLDLIPPSEGRLLDYKHSIVDDQGSIVTFAGMVFYEA